MLPLSLSVLLELPASVQALGGGLSTTCRKRLLTFCAGRVSGRRPVSFRPRPGLPVGLQQEPLDPGRDREMPGSLLSLPPPHTTDRASERAFAPSQPQGLDVQGQGATDPDVGELHPGSRVAASRCALPEREPRSPGDLQPHP